MALKKIRQIPGSYSSEAITCSPDAEVSEAILHCFVILVLANDMCLLVPTQGKVYSLGQARDSEFWVYLRYHRQPFYVARSYQSGTITICPASNLPNRMLAIAEDLAHETFVFDRRHIRKDADFPTPGEPNKEVLPWEDAMEVVRGLQSRGI